VAAALMNQRRYAPGGTHHPPSSLEATTLSSTCPLPGDFVAAAFA